MEMKEVSVYYVTGNLGEIHVETLFQAEAERVATTVYQDTGIVADIHVNTRIPKDWTK